MTLLFENDTSAIVKKLANRSIKADKRRNIFIIVTIAFAVCLMTTLALYSAGSQKQTQAESGGHYQATIINCNDTFIQSLENNSSLETYGVEYVFGQKRIADYTLNVLYEDKAEMDLMNEPGIVGALPVKQDEIIVQRSYLDYLGLSNTPGQTLTLDLGNGVTQDYTVSGILQDSNTSKIFRVITSKAYVEAVSNRTPLYQVRFRLVTPADMSTDDLKTYIRDFISSLGVADNDFIFSENYFTLVGSQGTALLSYLLGLVVVIACSLVIYSLFYISVVGKTKEYGRLKVLGCTSKQIKRIVQKETQMLSLISIPIGLVVGGIIGYCIFPKYWSWGTNLLLMLAVAVVIEIAITISTLAPVRLAGKVSAIEATHMTALSIEQRKSVTKKTHRKITPFTLAKMNFSRNRKKTVLTLLSLGFTGILLMCVASYSSSINYESMARQTFPNGNYTLVLPAYGSEMNDLAVYEEMMLNNPLNDEQADQLLAIDGVNGIIRYSAYSASLDTRGGNSDGMLITGLDKSQFASFQNQVLEGNFEYDTLVEEHGIVLDDPGNLINEFYGLNLKIGDAVTFQAADGSKVEYTVMGKTETLHTGLNGSLFILPDELLHELNPSVQNMTACFVLQTEPETDELRNAIYLAVPNQNITIQSFQDNVELLKLYVAPIKQVLYGLTAFIFLFGLINLANTLMTNLIIRQQEFGILQSVGLTNRQLSKMLSIECLNYVISTMLVTLTLGTFCGFMMCTAFNQLKAFGTISFHFPYIEVLVFFVALLVVQVIYSLITIQYSGKRTLVERIKTMD